MSDAEARTERGYAQVEELALLRAEVARLWEALLRYGRHEQGCVFWQDDEGDVDAYGPNGLCTSGLDDARLPALQPS